MIMEAGYITGRTSGIVGQIAAELKTTHLHQSVAGKPSRLMEGAAAR